MADLYVSQSFNAILYKEYTLILNKKKSVKLLFPIIMNEIECRFFIAANVSPVKLAPSNIGLLEGIKTRTSGWGKISDSK